MDYKDMTSQNRDQDRLHKIIKTVWSGFAAKIISVSISFVMVPLAVHYLGKEQYGLWVAVSSLVAMLGFMDGGAGNAVINLVAHASGDKNSDLGKIVSTAFFSLMALAFFSSLLFLAVFPYVSWRKVLGVSELSTQSDLNSVVIIVGLFFFVNMFITLVGKVQRGLQEGNLDNFWNAIAAILSLLLVYIAVKKDAGLVGFVVTFLAAPMIAYLASNIHYLFIRRIDLRPQLSKIDSLVAKNLFTVGGMFFVLQIAVAIQGQADNVIIANMLGTEAVASYAICMKLFLIAPMVLSLLYTPLWPAYREAFISGDIEWVKRIFFKSIRWSLFVSIPSAIILFFVGAKIIELWVGKDSVPSTNLLMGCSIWLVFSCLGAALAVFLNGIEIVKMQIIMATSSGIMNIILSIWLISEIGVAGAVFGSVISYFAFTLIPCFFIIRNIIKSI